MHKHDIKTKVEEYFNSHPKENEVHEALGNLFAEKERATKFLSGVAGRFVTTHTRGNINYEKLSDEIRAQIIEQEARVNGAQAAYETAPGVDKEKRMGDWHTEKNKLDLLQKKYDKQVDLEEKDELLAKENKGADLVKKPLTAEQLTKKIQAQELIIKATEDIIRNPKVNKKKKGDAAKVLESQKANLEELKKQLAALPEQQPQPPEAGATE